MFKGIFQKGVYGWLPLNGFSKAFKRSLVISTAGLGVIFTSWRLGLIKPYKAFQGLLIYNMYYIYIYVLLYKAHKA